MKENPQNIKFIWPCSCVTKVDTLMLYLEPEALNLLTATLTPEKIINKKQKS